MSSFKVQPHGMPANLPDSILEGKVDTSKVDRPVMEEIDASMVRKGNLGDTFGAQTVLIEEIKRGVVIRGNSLMPQLTMKVSKKNDRQESIDDVRLVGASTPYVWSLAVGDEIVIYQESGSQWKLSKDTAIKQKHPTFAVQHDAGDTFHYVGQASLACVWVYKQSTGGENGLILVPQHMVSGVRSAWATVRVAKGSQNTYTLGIAADFTITTLKNTRRTNRGTYRGKGAGNGNRRGTYRGNGGGSTR